MNHESHVELTDFAKLFPFLIIIHTYMYIICMYRLLILIRLFNIDVLLLYLAENERTVVRLEQNLSLAHKSVFARMDRID